MQYKLLLKKRNKSSVSDDWADEVKIKLEPDSSSEENNGGLDLTHGFIFFINDGKAL